MFLVHIAKIIYWDLFLNFIEFSKYKLIKENDLKDVFLPWGLALIITHWCMNIYDIQDYLD